MVVLENIAGTEVCDGEVAIGEGGLSAWAETKCFHVVENLAMGRVGCIGHIVLPEYGVDAALTESREPYEFIPGLREDVVVQQ